jgi:hypothetical protein
MRWLISLVCVLALGLMGCSETSGTGGSGGDAGVGGDGGNGGIGGGVLTVCVPPGDEWQPCRTGEDEPGYCLWDECAGANSSCVDVAWVVCADADTWPEDPGICVNGTCELLVESCTDQEDGTPCFGFEGVGWGICAVGVCTQEPD